MSQLIYEYINNLKVADNQLEQIIKLRKKNDPNYQIEVPLTAIVDSSLCCLYTNISYRSFFKIIFSSSFLVDNELLDTEYTHLIKNGIASVFDTGKTATFTYYFNNSFYEKKAFEWVLDPLYNALAEVEAVIISSRDINDKAAIEEMYKQNQLYQTLIDNFPDIIALHNREHRYLYVNSSLERSTGIAPNELVGKTFDALGFPESTWKLWCEQCERVFKTGNTITFNTEFESPKGNIKLETLLIPASKKEDKVELIWAIARLGPRELKSTLTELEQANAELKHQKRYFASIIENIPMIISRFDKNRRHIYVNPALETIFGVKTEQCIGKTWSEIGMNETVCLAFQQHYERVLSTGQTIEFEIQFPNGFDEITFFQIMLVPEMDETGQICTVLSIAQDITTKRNLERDIARLDRLNLVGEMAASIGHEVRNPLTTVRGYLQFFQGKDEFIHYREQYQIMIDELDRANFIISEFLSLAKNKTIEFKLWNLNSIINVLLPLIQADAYRCGHNITLDLGVIPSIYLDEKEIRQLLLNLTRNSFDAMNTGGNLTIQTYVDESNVVLAVLDTGEGIPQKIVEKLGTPFLTTKETGVGLGLAICYRIVDRHCAKINVQTSSSGTKFSILFAINQIRPTDN